MIQVLTSYSISVYYITGGKTMVNADNIPTIGEVLASEFLMDFE